MKTIVLDGDDKFIQYMVSDNPDAVWEFAKYEEYKDQESPREYWITVGAIGCEGGVMVRRKEWESFVKFVLDVDKSIQGRLNG